MRRLKYFRISPQFMVGLLTTGKHPAGSYEIVDGALPAGSKIINARWGWPDGVEFLVEHESFEPVSEGSVIPEIIPELRSDVNIFAA